MKARLFLLALAVAANVTAEASAQRFRDPVTLEDFGGDVNAMGYHQGWKDWCLHHNEDAGWAGSPHGNDQAPGYFSASQKAGYIASYRSGWDAARDHFGWDAARDYTTSAYWASVNGLGGYGLGGYGRGGIGSMNPVAALGQYDLDTSKAAINYQQAYRESLQNQKLRAQTYFDERKMHAGYRTQQQAQHPHATAQELAAFNQARLPAPLSADQFDPARGVIQWPGIFHRPEFDEHRTKLEGLFRRAAADPHASGLGTQNYRDIEHVVDEMHDQLHSEIAQFAPNEYIAASKFLKSLAHQARIPAAPALAKQ